MPLGYAPNYFADGTIEVCRFVKISPTTDEAHGVVQADADSLPVGISADASHDAPGLTGSLDDAARDGQPIHVHGPGEEALLEVAAAVAQGVFLRPDANGLGVIYTAGDIAATYVGAISLERATGANQRIRVLVCPAPARRA